MKDTKTPQTENLFEGWDDASDVDFFNTEDDPAVDNDKDDDIKPVDTAEEEDGEEEEVSKVSDDADDKDSKKKPAKKKDDVDVDGILNFDEDPEEQEEEEEEDDKGTKAKKKAEEKTSKVDSVNLLNSLKERGLVDFELEEGEELDEDRANELLEDSYEDTIEKRIEEMMADLPPVTRDLVNFSLKGGNESEFLSKLSTSKTKGISEDMDLGKEENQIAVMKANLKNDGYDDEYIGAQIDFMKDNGKLENLAKGVHKKIVERSKAERDAEVKRAADAKTTQKEKLREYKKTLSKLIGDTDEISGLTLSKKDKQELPSYMTDATVENGDEKVTPFQRDLFSALQDSNKAAAIAKILRSDFDFSDIANKSRTAQAKDIKKDVRRTSSKKAPASSGSSQKPRKRRSLADMF